MSRQIEIWYDETSDSNEPMWCVSLCGAAGDEVRCLSTHDSRDDAVSAGLAEAEKSGLVCYERSTLGTVSELTARE